MNHVRFTKFLLGGHQVRLSGSPWFSVNTVPLEISEFTNGDSFQGHMSRVSTIVENGEKSSKFEMSFTWELGIIPNDDEFQIPCVRIMPKDSDFTGGMKPQTMISSNIVPTGTYSARLVLLQEVKKSETKIEEAKIDEAKIASIAASEAEFSSASKHVLKVENELREMRKKFIEDTGILRQMGSAIIEVERSLVVLDKRKEELRKECVRLSME